MQTQVKVEDGFYVIRVPIAESYDDWAIRDVVDTLRVREILSRSQITEREVHELAEEVQATWWNENKDKFPDEADH